MASTATTRNRLNKQGTGDNTGSWGGVLNTQALDLVDESLDGIASVAVSGNLSLTSTNYATDQARRRVLKLTGAPGATYTVTVPSVEKNYFVHNATNAAQTIKAGGVGVSVPANSLQWVYCDGTDCFSPAQTLNVVVGAVIDFAGATAPSGWLLCYGQAVSRVTYAALFGVIGTAYGSGDGSSTFNVPDLRGRVSAGVDAMGGVAAGRLTSYTLAAAGGAQTHTLAATEIPVHGHSFSATSSGQSPLHTHLYDRPTVNNITVSVGGGGGVSVTQSLTYTATATGSESDSHVHTISGTTGNAGSGGAHANVQPTLALNKIIYAGV